MMRPRVGYHDDENHNDESENWIIALKVWK